MRYSNESFCVHILCILYCVWNVPLSIKFDLLVNDILAVQFSLCDISHQLHTFFRHIYASVAWMGIRMRNQIYQSFNTEIALWMSPSSFYGLNEIINKRQNFEMNKSAFSVWEIPQESVIWAVSCFCVDVCLIDVLAEITWQTQFMSISIARLTTFAYLEHIVCNRCTDTRRSHT